MKKYLLLIFSMLSVSIGAWADDPTSGKFGVNNNSEWSLSGDVLTLTFNNADNPINNYAPFCSLTGVKKVVVITGSGVTLSGGYNTALSILNDYYKSVPVVDFSAASINIVETYSGSGIYTIPMANSSQESFNNIIAPSSYSNGLNVLKVSNIYNWGAFATINTYSVSGTTVNAVFNTTADKFVDLTNIKSDYTKLKIINEVGAINLTDVLTTDKTLDLTGITTISDGSNNIVVPEGVNTVCLSDGVKNRIKDKDGNPASNVTIANPVFSGSVSEWTTRKDVLDAAGLSATSITITGGNIDATVLGQITNEGLVYLNLKDATMDVGINTMTVPSSLECLTLPESAMPESAIDATLLAKVKAANSLKYVYCPYSGTQGENQTVADYVWVNKSGGLDQALDNEARLKSAVYVKIASEVALNEDDAKFGSHNIINVPSYSTEKDYPWQYVDLSGTIVTAAATLAATAPHDKGYRIILPNNLTGDNMAIFASNSNKGAVAAVYSYNGTTLNIMEITDASYHDNALSDSRIVRAGTTAVKVVSGSYNGTIYSAFGANLLAALNNAASSITSATIAVGSGVSVTALTFTNSHLITLTLDNINNSSAVLNVGQCSALTTLNVQNATLSSISATSGEAKATSLANVDLDYTTTSGDIDLSGTALATLSADHTSLITAGTPVTYTGILKLGSTSVVSLNLSSVSAKSIDVQKANSLVSLNINGITLAPKDKSASPTAGTVDVTRDGNNYSNLTITSAEDFDGDRIIPTNPSTNGYTLTKIATPHAEITVADFGATGDPLASSNLNAAITTYNGSHDPDCTVGQIEVLHVTGTLAENDISFIGSSMPSLAVLDLSGVTAFGTGVDASTLGNKLSNNIPSTTVVILPTSNTLAEKKATMYTLQNAYYQCVGYFTETNKLSVYGYNERVGKLALATESPIVTTNTALTFLYRYSNTSGDFFTYPSATSGLLTGLSSVPAKSIDLTWLNISDLGTDFTLLNNNTHYLFIPQNSPDATTTRHNIIYHNDFADVSTSTSTDVYYSYNSNIWLVASYKSPVSPYASAAYFGGRALNYGEYGQNTTALLVYVTTGGAGNVNSVAINYLTSQVPSFTRFVGAGSFDATAIGGLTALTATEVDLTSAIITNDVLDDYTNSSVEYLALPDGSNSVINATSADNFAFSSCTNLKAVGAYDPVKNLYTVHSTEKTVTYSGEGEGRTVSSQENSLYKVTQLVAPNPSRTAGYTGGLGHLQASGYLTRNDICTNGSETQAGLANMTTSASFTTADLSKAVFLNQSDMTFFHQYNDAIHGANWGSMTLHIDLPTDARMTDIPQECFFGANDRFENGFGTSTTDADGNTVEGLCIPANYKYIRQNALYGLNGVTHLTTTPSNGVETDACDNGPGTLTLSASLLEIETGAFSFNDNGNRAIQHVYVLAKDAPKCASRAFPSLMTYGNNGYTNQRPYQFANYDDRMAILHFPNQLTIEQKKKYVDVTREYTLKDETGETDGDGNLLRWPTQSEFSRSYGQGQLGYIWDNWTGGRQWYNEEHTVGGEIDNTGYSVDGSSFIASYTGILKDGITRNTDAAAAKANNQNGFGDYLGWHEFCLGYSGYFYDVETQDEEEYYELDWYTVCIPYGLTPDMVAKAVGVKYVESISKTIHRLNGNTESVTADIYPEIRTFYGIDRRPSTGEILLHISGNLSDNSTGLKDINIDESHHGSLISAGANLIKGGYPYLIKPIVPKSVYDELSAKFTGAGRYILSKIVDKSGLTGYIKSFTHESNTTNVLVPFENHQLVAVSLDNGKDLTESVGGQSKSYLYNFIGTYTDRPMPQYCYYLGVAKSGVHKFFRSTTTKKTWNAYSAIIAPLGEATYIEDRQGESPTVVMNYAGIIDDTEGVAHSRVLFLFDNGGIEDLESDEATSIETIDGVHYTPITGKVYNMRGQYVGSSSDSLPKGVYIVNGKKFVVK